MEEDKIIPSKESPPKWKKFEQFVASIQQQITPNAQVKCNDMILGKSGINRQIDVSLRYRLGQFDILAVIDCKDWKNPIDINDLGSFADLVEDVRANKGALICNAGFTEGAKKRAIEKGIDLLQAVDTENIEWPLILKISVLCRCSFIKSSRFRFGFRRPRHAPLVMPEGDPKYIEIYREDNSFNDILINLLKRAWNEGRLPTEVGEHEQLSFIQDKAYIKTKEKCCVPVEITATILVDRKIFFGHVQGQKSIGFANGLNSTFTTNSLEFGIDFAEIEAKWRRLKKEDELSIQPSFAFDVVDCYPLLEYKPQS